MHYTLKALDEKKADDFINKLVEGTYLTKEHPITILRERFILDSRYKRKMPSKERVALIIKAWNLFRENKKISILRWDDGRETFPIAK